MVRLQIALNPPILKQQLPQGQKYNHRSHKSYDGYIHDKPKKANAKKRQIKEQRNARETNKGGQIGMKTLSILRIITLQLLMDGLPFSKAFEFRGVGLWFHICMWCNDA